ncbi:MAG: S-adenosylmethionine:tRNA ribosyltransferase-isomerase [Candidatus Hodarchaeales archaeon]
MTVVTNGNPIATSSRLRKSLETKLMVIDENSNVIHDNLEALIDYINAGDVIVVNNASTLPSSFSGFHIKSHELIEIRLVQSLNDQINDVSKWKVTIFGEGDWRIATEKRKKPPKLEVGDVFHFKSNLLSKIIDIDKNSILDIEFEGSDNEIWQKLYEAGKPTQYSYLEEELHLYDQQTIFSGPPLSLEPNSASFQLTWDLIDRMKKKGAKFVPITHAISLSSTGNEGEFDSTLLPFPERYWISQDSANEINGAIMQGKRIITVGTSVTRALESAADGQGLIKPGSEITQLRITKNHELKVVQGLLTGMHIPGVSHIDLLESFIPKEELEFAYLEANNLNYLWHEYGDVSLIFRHSSLKDS